MCEQGAVLRVIAPDWGNPLTDEDVKITVPPEMFPYIMAALSLLTHEEAWELTATGWDWATIQDWFEHWLGDWVSGALC